ncbi:single-stranded-DNA-specific exonuclease RecJ [Alteromonas halophila]|uniref:Single-stranded-DNA-specific exonuclease RecJ n=1 Tax=Alteromonas halophila TaxID=516698 RepID=A0A918MY29_9ALTE|nr:single-stranded-DNA-specific exonuclease RecJ [Alteromonas halophila]GGW80814.1 single-stranded-DNA-specific exonuclease RecJ [Alteromonas halophila]
MILPIVRRQLCQAQLTDSLHPVIERIYRGRHVQSMDDLETGLRALLHYNDLKDMDRASALLSDAVQSQRKVVIVGDFDADGATSTAVCMLALRQMGLSNLDYLVPNRFDFGYGLSEPLVDVAAGQGAELLITVDNGIACLDGVARARALGMQVIVTDHHLPAETLPDANAIVNPNQTDCHFASPSIAGVGVAFYLMLATRAHLQQAGWFASQGITAPNLAELLDIVAVGTVADVVRLDKNNRILVHQGLQRIRSGKCRPGIKALIEVAGRVPANLTSTDLGFVIGPRLNAAGRLDDMALGIACLTEDDAMQARMMAAELDSLNKARRDIEKGMKEEAMQVVDSLTLDSGELPPALVVYKPDFHQGVIGIVAGRIKEKYLRPAIAFANADETTLKGSARSIDGVHIRDLLDEINTRYPGVIEKFGGHAMAAGLSIPAEKLNAFQQAFEEVAARYLARLDDESVLLSDGELSSAELTLPFARQLRGEGPFGQGFEAPLFDGVFALVSQRIVGQHHLKLVLRHADGEEVDGIAFNVDTARWPDKQVAQVRVAYRLDVNLFRGNETVQLLVEQIEPYA